MPINEALVKAAEPLVGTLRRREDIDRARRVERAIDNTGAVILEGRDFIPVRSPDGSTWRIRVSNTGVISATKEA